MRMSTNPGCFVSRLIQKYTSSVSARSERRGVSEKRHPGGDSAQGPQRSARERRTQLHETADGECECHSILYYSFKK